MKNEEPKYTSDIAFTPAVKALQTKYRSRRSYEQMEQRGGWQAEISPQIAQFLNTMDSFYMGTASANGQPYIQHRGGPMGFLKVLGSKTLAFADFSGNKQFISTGNLSENGKAFIFLMDYPNRTRVKIWGTAVVVHDDRELMEQLSDPAYRAKPERAIVFTVEAWDVNCPQHIQPRFTKAQLENITAPLHKRIQELENMIPNDKSV